MADKIVTDNLTRRGAGRPKGSQNKTTKEAKALISEVAERLGGADRMYDWVLAAPENEKAFWSQVYPKLLPLTVGGDPGAPLVHEVILRAASGNRDD